MLIPEARKSSNLRKYHWSGVTETKEVLLHYFGLRSVHSDGLILTTVTGDNLIIHALDIGQLKTEKAAILLEQLIWNKDDFLIMVRINMQSLMMSLIDMAGHKCKAS